MGDGPAIELTGLTKRYGPVVGVDRLSLTVEPGEVFGFLGPNGAGKTTTLRCLTGLLRPSEGRVRVLGLDPIADHRRVAPQLGYLPGELRPTVTVAVGVALSPDIHRAVPIGRVFTAGVMGLGFALCLIGPAMAVSAAGRRRAQVVGATIAIGAVGFAVNFIALAWALPAPLRFLSPFHYYAPGDALAEGAVLWPQLGILVGAGVLGILPAHLLLRRRDLAP